MRDTEFVFLHLDTMTGDRNKSPAAAFNVMAVANKALSVAGKIVVTATLGYKNNEITSLYTSELEKAKTTQCSTQLQHRSQIYRYSDPHWSKSCELKIMC